ncbi:hypothetical protein ABZ951_10370 [Streptomyces sp. NPDC046215]|uniref:hypothetical protein n=1 Tax=Streptomyces sp. NPDC046215 TaxID=3155774 RepID=UPI0033FB5922
MRGRGTARDGLTGVALLGVLLAAAGNAAATGRAGGAVPYRTAPGAQEVRGSASSAGGPLLKPGAHVYTDSVKPGERKYYTVELDARSSAYVSAVAVPRPGSTMGARDGIDVALETADGTRCGVGRHRTFLSAGGAYPVADYAERVVAAGGACKAAGTYRFAVQRGEAAGGDGAAVPVELAYAAEAPEPAGAEAAPAGPSGGWSSRPPSRPAGPAEPVTGGSGFNDAAMIRPGGWKDELRPGETRFYRVAVEAGQQLFASARFGAEQAAAAGPFVTNGIRLGMNNAARGYVTNRIAGYQGRTATVSLATPPAASGAGGEAGRGMRRPGWYYLQVSLNSKVGREGSGGVPVTLTVDVAAAQQAGRGERGAARRTETAGSHPDERLRAIGYAGVGTGSLLLAGLGGWALAARREDG